MEWSRVLPVTADKVQYHNIKRIYKSYWPSRSDIYWNFHPNLLNKIFSKKKTQSLFTPVNKPLHCITKEIQSKTT